MTMLEWCSVIFQFTLLLIIGFAFLYILITTGSINEYLGSALLMLLVGIPQNLNKIKVEKDK